MALPTFYDEATESFVQKPLELNVDPQQLTIDEACLFEERGFTVTGLREFLIKYSNWTRAEIGALRLVEFNQIASMLRNRMTEMSVPFESSPK